MGLEKLEAFLDKSSNSSDSDMDRERIKQDWFAALNELFDKIENWLKPFADKNKLSLSREQISINELYFGEYKVSRLRIKLANQEVMVEPIGRQVIGAEGRADIRGPGGSTVKLLLVNKDWEDLRSAISVSISTDIPPASKAPHTKTSPELVWKIGSTKVDLGLTELTEDNFSDSLLELVNV